MKLKLNTKYSSASDITKLSCLSEVSLFCYYKPIKKLLTLDEAEISISITNVQSSVFTHFAKLIRECKLMLTEIYVRGVAKNTILTSDY